MKLKDWADKQGISYLTAWRWFKAGDPRLANAYQSDSGTIIVPDEFVSSELSMNNIQDSDVMAVVLKKTVEFSKNQYAIEDFAAWILSNFTLKVKGLNDSPKYSKVKPKSEDIQNHFKQFLKPKGEKPKPNMFVAEDPAELDDLVAKSDDLTTKELVEEIHKIGAEVGAPVNPADAPEVEELMKDLSSAFAAIPAVGPFVMDPTTGSSYMVSGVTTYDSLSEGVVNRSVDLTPQQLNYTGSTVGSTLSTNYFSAPATVSSVALNAVDDRSSVLRAAAFHPTQKEIEAASLVSKAAAEKPRRGRKPSKNQGNK